MLHYRRVLFNGCLWTSETLQAVCQSVKVVRFKNVSYYSYTYRSSFIPYLYVLLDTPINHILLQFQCLNCISKSNTNNISNLCITVIELAADMSLIGYRSFFCVNRYFKPGSIYYLLIDCQFKRIGVHFTGRKLFY